MNHSKLALSVAALLTLTVSAALGETPNPRMQVGSGAIEHDSWSGPTAGLPIRVVNHHGNVSLRSSADEGMLEAAAMFRQLDVDGSRLALDVSVTDDELVVSIVRFDLQGNPITQPSRTQQARADLAVLVPAGAPVHAETTFGRIEVREAHTDVELETVSGTIRVLKTVGAVTAHSQMGEIEVTLEKGATTKPQRLSTEAGAITVTTPPDAGLDVTMSTSGSFITDYSLKVAYDDGTQPDKTATATIGAGGAPLELSSATGDIGLRRPAHRR